MLERIFISKVRFKILQAFLLNPEKTYHVRGLVRKLDEEVNSISRELKNLELFGIIKSKKQLNKLVYSYDKTCIFGPELRIMFLKDTEEIKLLNKVLQEIEELDVAVVTKAYIEKRYTNDSDIDILLVGKVDVGRLDKEIKKMEKEIGRELKIAVLTPEEFEFQKKRREKFLLDIMKNDHMVLIGELNKVGL